ncbi:Drug/metabolite transporter [Penicillium angulare]|uniref:Drug/metabolite transporter n=1 Tax=Penicillium angulare TaxID=116970 RepID=A0A9W9EUA9_9EURO|nr:Drug/metabolite transporter [Penicillium angulare]
MDYSKSEEQNAEMKLMSNVSPRNSVSSRSDDDLEALNKEADIQAPLEVEYKTPPSVKYAWLCALLVLGMLLTIHNKIILGSFPCPWLLTGLHSAFSGLGTVILLKMGYFRLSTLSRRDHLILVAYSVLFSVNIFFSNFSLSLVSLAFFQIIRNTSPIFTVFLERVLFTRSYSLYTYLALIPIVMGAAMTASGELQFTYWGLFISVIGVVLGVLKIIITNRLMTGSLSLSSLELIYRMSIHASIQSFIIGLSVGELSKLSGANVWVTEESDSSRLPAMIAGASLVGNGMLAFFLNIASFQATKVAGSLAITVWGNIRQTLTLILGIVFLGDFNLNPQTAAGIVLVVLGCGFYNKAEIVSKR